MPASSALRAVLEPPGPVDVHAVMRLSATGAADPTSLVLGRTVWRAMRTPVGTATLAVRATGTAIEIEAWGAGASAAIAAAPRLLGFDDDPSSFAPPDAFMADLHRRHPALRIGATGSVVDALVPAILEQKVTTVEAHRSWRRLVRAHGEPAPGPLAELRLPPDPQHLARLGYADFHPLGVERRRADVIRAVCRRANRLDALRDESPVEARRLLELLPGIGPWTSAVVTLCSHGDPDAVIVGDYNLPGLVAFSLTGERNGTDEQMLELLEPYRGHRARAQLLLKRGGASPPRRAPRARLRDLSRI